jgi:hypothetical protein
MAAVPSSLDQIDREDVWPRTKRPLPWLIAGFLGMIFLVPFESINFKVSLPINPSFDRFYIGLMVATWALTGIFGRESGFRRLRPRGWSAAITVFAFVAIASLAVNFGRITNLAEWEIAQKRLALLVSLIAVFVVIARTLRVAELRSFAVLIVILGIVTSLGTICEEKTGYNVFYSVSSAVFSPVAEVEPAPTDVSTDPSLQFGRPMVTGPTKHALSVASILGMAVPFALVLAATTPATRRRLLWILAACLMFGAALITQRKSGAVVPAVALLALFVMRPRQLIRLAPFGIVALALGLVLSGGSFSSIHLLRTAANSESTIGRTSDYEAVVPDLLSNPLLGRGYGTLDPARIDTYRIFDNEYLGQLYQVGAIGLLTFLALILTPLLLVRNVVRSENSQRGPPALAASAGCLAFAVATCLYDILSFAEAPYLFLFLAGMCICAASVEVPVPRKQRAVGAHGPAIGPVPVPARP